VALAITGSPECVDTDDRSTCALTVLAYHTLASMQCLTIRVVCYLRHLITVALHR